MVGRPIVIERSGRRIAAARMASLAGELLNASPLCAIATVAPNGRAHVNTAYFSWSPRFDILWLSDPHATHSRNIRARESVATAVYDSNQSWEGPDRGIQLFGTARELRGATVRDAEALYGERFRESRRIDLGAYRFYRFRPRRFKLFDERALGAGVFVSAKVASGGRLTWERTEAYRAR